MTIVGLHGVKRRWVEQTVTSGLRRDSAAWFLIPLGPTDAELDATFAAAVYLALATTTRARLVADPVPGHYGQLFGREPELLPDLIFFSDRPTGRETLHRYLWQQPPAPARTVPYTKVARANRDVTLDDTSTWVYRGDALEIAAIEQQVDEAPKRDSWWRDPGLLRRIELRDPVSEAPVALQRTKIGAVCWAVAHLVRAAIVVQAGAR